MHVYVRLCSLGGVPVAVKHSTEPELQALLQKEVALLEGPLKPLQGSVVPRLVAFGWSRYRRAYWVATGMILAGALEVLNFAIAAT